MSDDDRLTEIQAAVNRALESNAVVSLIRMSGECPCGAFAKEEELGRAT